MINGNGNRSCQFLSIFERNSTGCPTENSEIGSRFPPSAPVFPEFTPGKTVPNSMREDFEKP